MLLRSVRNALIAFINSLERRVVARPFSDTRGEKGRWAWLSRAPAHRVGHLRIEIVGWPKFSRPLRILFASDLHVGSHTEDVERLTRIFTSAAELKPDLLCVGGDYINGMLFGGGRVPPTTAGAILSLVKPPLGSFAILGDHDKLYGAPAVSCALRSAGLSVLLNETARIVFEEHEITIVGVAPEAARLPELLRQTPMEIPRIILAHDPAAFALLPKDTGDLMLCGHTHGGQIQLPMLGPLINMSDAPLAWTYGHVIEGDCHLYVTSGLGTSLVPIRLGIAPEVVLIEVHGVYTSVTPA